MAPTAEELIANGEAIAKAAGEMSSEPLAYMKLAHQYTEQACDLNPLAFGVVCSVLLSSSYETSRSDLSGSIQEGVKQLETAAGGLVKVANTIAEAEVASAADAKANRDPGFTYTKPQTSGGLGGVEGGLIAGGWGGAGLSALLAKNIAIATANGASAALAPTAIASTIAWLLFTPMDSDIQEAKGGWDATKAQLDGVVGTTWEGILTSLGENWKGDSKTAFDNWAGQFKAEVTQTAEAAAKNSQALVDMVQQIHTVQHTMAFFAFVSLAAIIVFSIGEKLPYVGPLFTLAKNIQGAIQSAGTITAISAILAIGGMTLPTLLTITSALGTNFATLKVNQGGGTSFDDVNIAWAKPDVPVPGA